MSKLKSHLSEALVKCQLHFSKVVMVEGRGQLRVSELKCQLYFSEVSVTSNRSEVTFR